MDPSPQRPPERCPQCGARWGADAQWCGLCGLSTAATVSPPVTPQRPPRKLAPGEADAMLAELAATRAPSYARGLTGSRPARAAMIAGAMVVIIVVLMAGMTLAGLLL